MPVKSIRNRTLFYQDVGQGYPILFGHGFLMDRNVWRSQVEILSKQYRCIVPDLWSHGFSEEVPQRPYSIELLAEDYYHLMRSLGFNQFAVCGLSLGGIWGTQLALTHPQTVQALILVNTPLHNESESRLDFYLSLLGQIERSEAFTSHIINLIIPLFFSAHSLSKRQELVNAFIHTLKSIPHERLAGLIELGHTFFSRPSMLNKLDRLSCPLMYVAGHDDVLSDGIMHEQKLKALGEFHIIDHAGHSLSLECPEALTRLIKAFGKTHRLNETRSGEGLCSISGVGSER